MRAFFFTLLLVSLFNFEKSAYIAVLPLYLTEQGLSSVQITLLYGGFTFAVMIFSSLLGHLSDILGRMFIIRLGVVMEMIALLLYLFMPFFLGFFLARICNAFALVAIGYVGLSFSEDHMKGKDRVRGTGIYMSVTEGATVLAPLLLGVFGTTVLFFPFVLSLGITTLLYLILYLYIRKHPLHERGKLQKKDFHVLLHIQSFLAHPSLRVLLVPALGVYFAAPLCFIFLPLFVLKQLGGGPEELFFLHMSVIFFNVFQFYYAPKLREWGIVEHMVYYAPFFLVGVYFVIPFLSSFPLLVFFLLLFSLAEALWMVSLYASLSDIGEELGQEGTVMGAYFSLVKMAQLLGYIAGSIGILFFGLTPLFFLLSLVLLVTLLYGLFLRRSLTLSVCKE